MIGDTSQIAGGGPRIALAYVRRDNEADARYLAVLERAGAVSIPLWADDPDWERSLEQTSGLLFTGGGDIHPALYGAHDGGRCAGVDEARDARETAAFRIAEQRQLPMLAICRGMQLINVLYGAGGRRGSLLEDIGDFAVRHRNRLGGPSAYHPISVSANTRLSAAIGRAGTCMVNSRHHQGLRLPELAVGLITTAVAADGIVEALEAPGERFFVGVQCHPEIPGEVPEFAGLFAAFIAAARARQRAEAALR
ncbi:MAG: gamma-glutamyl-gamma-aminobutyrate hydrolase family protein [Chloroflexota bacterium]